jgi:hypothetical protein
LLAVHAIFYLKIRRNAIEIDAFVFGEASNVSLTVKGAFTKPIRATLY